MSSAGPTTSNVPVPPSVVAAATLSTDSRCRYRPNEAPALPR
jgi:hypothetical protein